MFKPITQNYHDYTHTLDDCDILVLAAGFEDRAFHFLDNSTFKKSALCVLARSPTSFQKAFFVMPTAGTKSYSCMFPKEISVRENQMVRRRGHPAMRDRIRIK